MAIVKKICGAILCGAGFLLLLSSLNLMISAAYFSDEGAPVNASINDATRALVIDIYERTNDAMKREAITKFLMSWSLVGFGSLCLLTTPQP